jgi:hypothetical protein
MAARHIIQQACMATGTHGTTIQVFLVSKGDRALGMRRWFKVVRVAVTHSTHLIIFHIMTIGAHVHGGK